MSPAAWKSALFAAAVCWVLIAGAVLLLGAVAP